MKEGEKDSEQKLNEVIRVVLLLPKSYQKKIISGLIEYNFNKESEEINEKKSERAV